MIHSLRLRLVCVTLATMLIGLAAAALMSRFESRGPALSLPRLLEEPYQDFLMMGSLGLVAVVLTWVVAGWSLRPVSRASRSAAVAGPDNIEARVALHGLPSEIRPLVEAFNDALDRLSDAYLSERRFISDAAHELRTPLAILSLRLQKARDGTVDWAALDRDVVGIGRLATQLLDLARKDHLARLGDVADLRTIDLARLAREAAAAAVPMAEAASREIVVEAPDHLPMVGRADDLRDLIRNLLDNALLHGRGTVWLRCCVEDRDGAGVAALSVEDEGAGVPSGLETILFDRFRKVDPISAGHGLGLAIVREAARGAGGRVGIRPGPGCRVSVQLPLGGTPTQNPPDTAPGRAPNARVPQASG